MYRQILFHYLRLKIFNIILNKFSYLLKYIDKTDKYQFRLIFQMSRNTFPVKRCVGRIIFIFEFCLIIHFFWWHIYHFLQVYLDKANNNHFRLYFICFETSAPRTEEGQRLWDILICELYLQIDEDFCMFVHWST